MSVYLDIQNELLALAASQPEETNQPAPKAESAGQEPSSASGEKHFQRLHRGTAVNTKAEAPETAPEEETQGPVSAPEGNTNEESEWAGMTVQQIINSMMEDASYSMAMAEKDTAEIMSLTSQQAQASANSAQQNQADFNAQMEKKEHRQKHMRWISWGTKAVGVALLVTGMAKSNPLMTPFTHALTFLFGSVAIVRPQLISKCILDHLTKGLEAMGMPDRVAKVVAPLIIIAAAVGLTVACGGADAGLDGKLAEKFGKKVAFSFVKSTLGSTGIIAGLTTGLTNFFTHMMEAICPNHPKMDHIVGGLTTLAVSIALMVGGSKLMVSAGSGNAQEGVASLKTAMHGLQGLEAVGRVGSAEMGARQGITMNELAQVQASLALDTADIQTSASFSQTAQQTMDMIGDSMSSIMQAMQSLATPTQAVLDRSA